MREFHNEVFQGWSEYDSGRTHAELNFNKCDFRSCSIGVSVQDLSRRPCIARAEFKKCTVTGCSVIAATIEDTIVDGLGTSGLFQTWAAVFRHVTLKGKIDRVMFSPFFHPGFPSSKFQQVVNKANADYYAEVDWALDIREAEFIDFDCRGVPSRLVRRDPATQVMVTRERLLASGESIAVGGNYWHGWLKLFLEDNWYTDGVLVAPKRDRRFRELVVGLQELRRCGVAEAD